MAEWAAGRQEDGEPPLVLEEEEAWILVETLLEGLVEALVRLGTRLEGALELPETRREDSE